MIAIVDSWMGFALMWFAVLLTMLVAVDGLRSEPFNRFPAIPAHTDRLTPLRLNDPLSRTYRSALQKAARGKANFAGHYVLAEIGCGAGCIEIAAIDRATGSVVWFPSTVSGWPSEVMEPLSFRLDSDLLVVRGMLDERGPDKTRLYLFRGKTFQLVKDFSRREPGRRMPSP